MDRARAAGRRVPPGNQGAGVAGAGRALRDRGLLVLLARRRGLLRASGCTCAESFPAARPSSRIPPFDLETRIVAARVGALTVASIYVPNGGKDFPAKMKFLEALDAFAESFRAGGGARDSVRRSERRADRARRAPEGAQAARGRAAAGRARPHRAPHRPRPRRRRPRARPRQRRSVHVVGALAQPAPAQHRLAARLRAGERADRVEGDVSSTVAREFGTSDHGPVTSVFDVEPASFATPGTAAVTTADPSPPRSPGRLF